MRYIKSFNEAESQDLSERNPPIKNEVKNKIIRWCKQGYKIDGLRGLQSDGVDLRHDNFLIIRNSCRAGKIDVIKYFIENKLITSDSKNMPLCWACEHSQMDIINFLLSNGFNNNVDRAMAWLIHSRFITMNEKLEIIDYLQSKIESGEATVGPKSRLSATDDVKPGDFFKGELSRLLF